MAFFNHLFAEQPGLAAKLAAMQPPENIAQLETEFKNYTDPDWIKIEDGAWTGIWRLHAFGLWRLQRLLHADQTVVECARKCFEACQRSFERLVSQHKEAVALKRNLTHNPSVALAQCLTLMGMPWHQIKQRELHSNLILQEVLQKYEQENGEWPQLLFTMFGPEAKMVDLQPEEWARLEIFLWKSIALMLRTETGHEYVTWMDLLEEWAAGSEQRKDLVNNLKEHFKLVRCGKLFTDIFPPRPPSSPATTDAAASQIRLPATSRHGRGSGISKPAAASSSGLRSRAASQDVARHSFNQITEQDSLRQFLVDNVLAQTKESPGIDTDALKRALLADSTIALERRCLSVQLFLMEFNKLLMDSPPEKAAATRASGQSMLGRFFCEKESLRECLENSIVAALILQRISACPYVLNDQWLKPFTEGCKTMQPAEREELFAFAQKIPIAPRGKKPAPALDLDADLEKLLGYKMDPLGTFILFVQFLSEKPEESAAFINRRQLFEWIGDAEKFLGMPLSDEIRASLFMGAPIPSKARSTFTAFHTAWRPEILRNSLFLNETAVSISLPATMAHWTDFLVVPQTAPPWLESRKKFVEMLILANFRPSPSYWSSLLQFKGLPITLLPNESGEAVRATPPSAVLLPEGTLIPLATQLKNYSEQTRAITVAKMAAAVPVTNSEVILDGAAFGRHVHFCSAWKYSETIQDNRKQTFGTMTCFLLLSLTKFKARQFEVALPIPLEVFAESTELSGLFKHFTDKLTCEQYAEGQEEEMDEDAHLTIKDDHQKKLKKIHRALEKLNNIALQKQVEVYLGTAQGLEAREKNLIALFEFFLELKVKFRQAGYAFVDSSKLPREHRHAIAYAYGEINPLEEGKGWTILPLSDARASTSAYCVLQRDIEQTVEYVYLESAKPEPEPIIYEMFVEPNQKPTRVAITSRIMSYEGGKVVALSGLAVLGEKTVTSTPFCYPLGCKEHDAKQVIALLLCEMKRLYHRP